MSMLTRRARAGGEQMTRRASTTVRYETRTTIDRPVSDVFDRLGDLDGYRTWMRRTGLFRRSGQTSDGPLGLGTTYFDATWMGTFRGQVTEYDPPAAMATRHTGRLSRRCLPADSPTLVRKVAVVVARRGTADAESGTLLNDSPPARRVPLSRSRSRPGGMQGVPGSACRGPIAAASTRRPSEPGGRPAATRAKAAVETVLLLR